MLTKKRLFIAFLLTVAGWIRRKMRRGAIITMVSPLVPMGLEDAPNLSDGYGMVINQLPERLSIGRGGGINGL